MSQGFSIYGDREYFPCGCSYIIDPKTGETVQSFPCDKHKYLEASQTKGAAEMRRDRPRSRPKR